MSLTGAINSAVSSLYAQSRAMQTVSDNLANIDTYGYKTLYTSFESLVSGSVASSSTTGGVRASDRSYVSEQGLITSTTSTTDLAIQGSGFFAVSTGLNANEVYYTRNGQFDVDDSGYLTNGGYYLLGWQTDADGNVSSAVDSALQAIDLSSIKSDVSETAAVAMEANLPADAATGDTFDTSFEVVDSLGTTASVTVTWTKTAENTWTASFADPTSGGETIGTVSSSEITISFNEDGSFASTNPSPATMTIDGWTDGASDSTISFDFGTAGSTDGLTQHASGDTDPTVEINSVDQDGISLGKLDGISIGSDGSIVASFDNGESRTVFKIPLASFTNANGLTLKSGSIYAKSSNSGSATLHLAGTGGTGSISGGSLETSTADTTTEFSRMMSAQQAYSAAAQVMSAANDLYDTLIGAVR